ncbi:MAG TPA: NrfD/PsrC family molybdoenzyme membrane anchor subunit [Propionibacteriaceae bacterium]|nr:NrfD/PsrC family molybdoenzyme membrane anchor subunit [Propionibacteriaceae bacterium]
MSATSGSQNPDVPPAGPEGVEGRDLADARGGPAASTADNPPNSTVDIGAVPGSAGQAESRVGAAKERLGEGRKGDGRKGRRKRGRAEEMMVPDVTFESYYGRQVVKAAPWEAAIPAYLFMGGLAAGSALLGAGADLSGRPTLRRAGRIGSLGFLSLSMAALVADLGRPERFINMLRVFKPTSPMSVGTWILTAFGPGAAVAGGAEIARLLPYDFGVWGRLLDFAARPAGLSSAVVAPAVASYTAVLLTDTATPAWHDAHRELPFVFVGSAAAASGGFGMLMSPVSEAGPARRLAIAGAIAELAVEHKMEQSMGLSAEALHHGTPGRLIKASKALTAIGALGAALLGGHRVGAAISGVALMAGSACTRFGVFEAGIESAHDPKYTVVPQRMRANRRAAEAKAERVSTVGTDATTEEI